MECGYISPVFMKLFAYPISISPCDFPLHTALASRKNCETSKIRRLFNEFDVTEMINKKVRGVTPLHIAASNSSCEVDVIRLLLQCGADVDLVNDDAKTALHLAIEHNGNNYDIIEELLNHNAPLEIRDSTYNKPLHIAVTSPICNPLIIKALIQKGASLTSRNRSGYDAFKLALVNRSCNLDVVKVFLDNGASLNCSGSWITPLQVYLTNRICSVDVVHELVDRGSDMAVLDTDKKNLLHRTIMRYRNLSRYTRDVNCYNLLLALIKKGNFDINAVDYAKQTVLHLAVNTCRASKSVVALLLQHGANARALNAMDQSPLHCAVSVKYCNLGILQLLLDAGSSVSELDKSAMSPLGIIMRRYQKFPGLNRACVELLLKYAIIKSFVELGDVEPNFQGGILDGSLCVRDYGHLSDFIDKCCQEIAQMKADVVGKDFSLFDFIRYTKRRVDVKIIKKVLTILCCNNYPTYNHIIAKCIDRSQILKILHSLQFYCIKKRASSYHKIVLVADCIDNIVQHLCKNDLLNLTIAYHESKYCNSVPKQSTKRKRL